MPERSAGRRVQAKHFAAAVTTAGDEEVARQRRHGIDVQAGKVPAQRPGRGFQAIDAIVAGPEKRTARFHAGTRLDVAVRGETPQFRARGGVEAVKPAVRVFVQSLTDVQPARVQRR